MDISSALRTARRLWIAVVALALVGAGVGALVAGLTPARYSSSTSLYFAYDAPADAAPSDLVQANNFALQKVFSYQQLVVSPRVLDGVISDLGMNTTAEDLAEDVSVSIAENSVVMTITAQAANPQDAAVLAQSVADNLVKVVVDQLEAPASGGTGPLRAEVIAPASEGESSRPAGILLGLQLGLFGGLVVGLALAVLLTFLDRRVHSRAQLEDELGLRVLAGVPVQRRPSAVEVLQQPTSPTASGYRAAASSLLLDTSVADAKGLAVLASTEREDSAEAACNLAASVAAAGFNVLLLDADPGNHGVTTRFELDGVPGLVEKLVDGADVGPTATSVPGLRVIPVGRTEGLGGRSLPAAAFTELVEDLCGTADLVLVSCPPVLGGAGYSLTASSCGGALLVVRAGAVTTPQVRAAIADLEETGLAPVGTLVTDMPTRGPDSDPAVRALAGRRR
ncbi:hypothetical protein FHN55_17870 [Streptomyces sp. NP160]|uniref:hypothetical protein n=1 Tax=Streptomyces sp. NP160 TaxID=2586637 RepID=UPI00111B36F7|nr:hypothetical protein [Streptomyces sp. NP160]TNM61077.1 hypothetical protein FHN55_17870 [Streptomyces sp. NP160]